MSKTHSRPGGPAEPAPYGEEGQPRLVLAGQHLDREPGALADLAEHGVAVAGVADRRGREGQHVLAALLLRHPLGAGGEGGEGVDPLLRTRLPSSSRCSASRSGSL